VSKLVVLRLDGNLQHQGFRVTLTIGEEGNSPVIEVTGNLPPAPELVAKLQYHWLQQYRSLGAPYRIKPRRIIYEGSLKECQKSAVVLRDRLTDWLNYEHFRLIDQRLREALNPDEEIHFLIRTEDRELQKLPWHLWDFFERYPKAEVTLSTLKLDRISKLTKTILNPQVKILAILGHSEGLDLQADRQLLENLPRAETTFLVEQTRREINDQLWEQPWDIIFFAGHSATEGEKGKIYINPEESLSIDELWYALKTAVEKGLKLAIFNSCDGLELALRLNDLQIPQIIVMRDLVPDRVAHTFLKYFLKAYSEGKAFYLAVREARERLQGLEGEFPCASWLPVIYQNSSQVPPTWFQLAGLPPCPYRGLLAFREQEARFFKGRELFTEQLIRQVKKKPLVALIGASGSGKSSVVFAGLIPRLRASTTAQIVAFRPAKSPFAALATALLSELNWQVENTQSAEIQLLTVKLAVQLRHDDMALVRMLESRVQQSNRPLVLVVDQFEELYTISDPEEGQLFLESLLNAVNCLPAFTLILTLRVDFLGRAIAYQPLAKALQDYPPHLLIPMNCFELERAIALPAADMNVRLEEGLTQRLINAVGDRPGRLPLLEFALTKLWSKQKNGRLTHQAYEEIGGVEEALANHAEAVYAHLIDIDRQRAQRIFIQLVRPGEGTEDTRRLATRDEVKEENWDLVKRLADERLVVTDHDNSTGVETVEIVHEALINNWKRLKQWMQVGGEFRRWQEHLRTAMRQWESSEHDDSDLLRGKHLSDAEDWQQKRAEELSNSELVFIQSSLELRDRQIKTEKRRQQRTISGLTIGLILAASLTGIAWLQTRKALISELQAIATSSKALFISHQKLDALVKAIEARQKWQRLGWTDAFTQIQVESALRQAVYGAVEYNRLSGYQDWVWGIAFSPDGQTIASASADKTVKLWKRNGSLLAVLKGHEAAVNAVAFSPDSQMIASASDDRTVKLWQPDGTLLRTIYGHSDRVWGIAFSPDGQTFASASWDRTIKLWKLDGTLLTTLKGHQAAVNAVAFSPDGQKFASVSDDQTVKLWQSDGTLIRTIKGHEAAVYGITFSPDGQTLASASDDKTVKLWQSDGTLIRTIKGHEGAVWGVAFSPDGQTLASASDDQTVKLWNRDGTLLATLNGHNAEVYGVAFSPDGQTIASTSNDRTVKLWQPNSSLLTRLSDHSAEVWGVAFSPNGQTIASASGDNTVKLWHQDGTLIHTLSGHSTTVYRVTFSPDGQTIASASGDKTVKLWHRDGTLLHTLHGHQATVWGVAFSPDSQTIASASDDRTIKLWQRDGTLLRTFNGHSTGVSTVVFSPDGQMIASASDDHTIKLWQRDGTLVRTLPGHGSPVWTIAFSPDGQILASGSDDRTIKLWQRNGTLIRTIDNHDDRVLGVAFSPDGQMLASASGDKTIKLWNLDGTLLATLNGHDDWVYRVAFSPDGQTLASASRDKTLILWNLSRVLNLNELAYACDWVRDYLKTNINVSSSNRYLCNGIK
jgi:WD40 repeat protein